MHHVKRAIIMAAGKGERLLPLTNKTPKPLIEVNGRRMIETVIEALRENGISDIYIVVGYLKEQFGYLVEKYPGIRLIENPYYEHCNNISSLYMAREYLDDCMILDGDQIIYNPSVLAPDFERSGYNAVWTEEETSEWLMTVEDGIVTSCSRTGGKGGWQLYSISRWSSEDGKRLRKHLEAEFEQNKRRKIYWDDVPLFCYPKEYQLGIWPMNRDDVVEIDSLEELEKTEIREKEKKKKGSRSAGGAAEILGLVAAVLFSAGQNLMFQISCLPDEPVRKLVRDATPLSAGISILILFTVSMLLKLLAGKWGTALFLGSILMTVWAAANYFTILYHGAPLFVSELKSAGTAMEVMGTYEFGFDPPVRKIIIIGGIMIASAAVLMYLERKMRRYTARKFLGALAATAACLAALYVLLFSPYQVKPTDAIGWRWVTGIRRFGFPACAVEDVEKTINSLKIPAGYSTEIVSSYEADVTKGTAEQYPDIILILNESFYNVNDLVDTKSDTDCMQWFYGIENALYGHSVVSSIGGGTNNSEFEYLTGNSMALLRNYAPFNYYNFELNKDNYVTYLKKLGYTSAALHCGLETNYRRNVVYPQLGFDKIVMGRENFNHHEFKYGKRKVTDSDNYKDMIDCYDSMDEGPRFVYMLTYQNHGGYRTNDDDLDVVHASKDFGKLTSEVNEFMSTIYYSAKAFKELTDYYADADRPVIICMAGDHAPSFVSKLQNDSLTEEEISIRSKAVPYVIWSNYEIDTDGFAYNDYVTEFELMALVLKMAGMPMTPYQKQILDLQEAVPVLTSDGMCMDREGKIVPYTESESRAAVEKYYNMEYNTLKHGNDYREELFTIPD